MEATQFSLQNFRPYQEDRSFIKILNKDEALLGVFDGHGSHWVSDYASNHTPFLFRSMRKTVKQDPEEALKQLFQKLVNNTLDICGGSTASIVWLKNNIAHVGCLGDSLTIIKDANGQIWQSPEHNVRTNQAEALAAEGRGGKISLNGYLFDKWQIDGNGLQMSRALGDKDLNRVLNREPEIFHIPVNEQSWILICSDGLIDPSHKNKNSVTIAAEFIEKGSDAEELVTSMALLDKSDNSTAIVVRIG